MARRIGVEIVGDSTSLEKAFARSSKSASKFNRDVSKATRGAIAGTGVFKTFGRSLAFASGGFLAFEGVTSFLTDSINAAREAGVANRSLAAQMKASGESFRKNRDEIEKVALSYGKFGFQNDEVVASLAVLERGTGKINQALRLQGLTADIARAKNIELSAAANVVAKVFGRQETALRRAVPGLHKNAHGWDLIREAQQKMAGQAAAATTSSERFAAVLHDTQELIGAALLPTLNKYLDTLSKWLSKSENQKKVQKDVTGGVRVLTGVLNIGVHAVEGYTLAWEKFAALSHRLGGTGLNEAALRAQLLGKPGAPGLAGPLGKPGKPSIQPGLQGPVGVSRVRAPTSLLGRFNIQELKLAQAQLTARLSDDRRILIVEKAIVEQQIKQAKTLKDRTALTNTLAGIVGRVRDIDQQAADAIKAQAQARKDAAKAAKEAAQEAKRAAKERQASRLQTGIDWLDFGLEKAQATKGIGDDIKAEKKIISALKEQARLTGLTVDIARQIFEHRQALSDLMKQKATQQQPAFAGSIFRQAAEQLTIGGQRLAASGTGAQFRQLTRLGVTPSTLPGRLQPITINGGLHLHGVQNVAQLESELQKRTRTRPQPRRGH